MAGVCGAVAATPLDVVKVKSSKYLKIVIKINKDNYFHLKIDKNDEPAKFKK